MASHKGADDTDEECAYAVVLPFARLIRMASPRDLDMLIATSGGMMRM